DLRKILSERGRFPQAEALRLISQTAAGVQAMHDAGLVHRDLKPENVLVEDGPHARVTDFGLARAVSGAVLTRTEQLVGTAEYLAPELVAGRPLTPAADVYSLGVMGYEMSAGFRPFEAEHPAAVLRGHLDTAPARPDGFHDPVWDLVASMLAKDPAERPVAGEVARYSLRLAEWVEKADWGGRLAAGDPPRLDLPPAPVDPRPADPLPAAPSFASSSSGSSSSGSSGSPGSSGAETSFSLTPLPEAPPAAAEKAAESPRRRRRLIAGIVALLVLAAAGGGVWAALAGRHKPNITTLRPYDVTTSVTVAHNGDVTVTWTPVSASSLIIAVSTGPVAQRAPVAVVADSQAGSYLVTGTAQGLHCFFAEAYFTGPPPRGITQSTNTRNRCVTVP
ncbi:MAG: serine/threonine protein kinase, partial [Acidimicrobiaceae bacterium]|nr:serine/threonine protein kinase [Acidimicrobiaceae bacterium]